MNDNTVLQKILIKILNKAVIDRFHNELSKKSISHTDLSEKAGKVPGAFNKNFNSGEQLTLASFLRFSLAASELSNQDFYSGSFSLNNLLSTDELKLIQIICSLKDYDISNFSSQDILFFKHFIVYYDSLKYNNKLTQSEIYCFNKYINKKDVF